MTGPNETAELTEAELGARADAFVEAAAKLGEAAETIGSFAVDGAAAVNLAALMVRSLATDADRRRREVRQANRQAEPSS